MSLSLFPLKKEDGRSCIFELLCVCLNYINLKNSIMSESKVTNDHPKKADVSLAASIYLAVDMESTFKLYSYRILTPEQFLERTKELVEDFSDRISKTE